MKNLHLFLTKLFKELHKHEVNYLILRNYKNLPEKNDGNDIDFLVEKKDLPIIEKILTKFKNIKITYKIERTYVVNYFIYGVIDSIKDTFTLQIDFVFEFSWKGFDYLSVKKVLQSKRKYKYFYVPHPVHEAIISFFSSFLIGGFIREKYFTFIQFIFKNPQYKDEIRETLSEYFNKKNINNLVKDIALGHQKKLLKDIWQYKIVIIRNNFKRYPFLKILNRYIVHHIKELLIRSQSTKIVVLLGPDGVGKSTIINIIYPHLKHITKEVEVCHLRSNIFPKNKSNDLVKNPHGKPTKGILFSFLQLIYWVIIHNLSLAIKRPRAGRIIIYDRYFHDLLIDPIRYRYGGPRWLIKLMSRIIRQPDIFICIEVPPNIIQNRKTEVHFKETVRQMAEYKNFIKRVKNGYLVNGNREKKEVAKEIENIIVCYFSNKATIKH